MRMGVRRERGLVITSDKWPPKNEKTAEVLKAVDVLTWRGDSGPNGQEHSSSGIHFLTREGVPMWGLHTGGNFPIRGWGSCQ